MRNGVQGPDVFLNKENVRQVLREAIRINNEFPDMEMSPEEMLAYNDGFRTAIAMVAAALDIKPPKYVVVGVYDDPAIPPVWLGRVT